MPRAREDAVTDALRNLRPHGVPQHDTVEDQAECGELVFHPGEVGAGDLAFAAVEDSPGEVVAAFGEVGPGLPSRLYGSSSARRKMCRVLKIRP